jgi:hypothetical protein
VRTFYHPELGHFNSSADDLSDLGEPYLSAAKEQIKRQQDAPNYSLLEPIMGCEWGVDKFPG